LESSWAIGETKVHNQRFKETMIRLKHCLPLVALSNADIVVSPSHIKLGEVLHALESMDEIVNEWKGVSIFSCDVECSIVLNKMELTILLLDEEDWGTYRGFRLSDAIGSEGFLQESIHICLFGQHHRIYFSTPG
jgi:hypothetical protein